MYWTFRGFTNWLEIGKSLTRDGKSQIEEHCDYIDKCRFPLSPVFHRIFQHLLSNLLLPHLSSSNPFRPWVARMMIPIWCASWTSCFWLLACKSFGYQQGSKGNPGPKSLLMNLKLWDFVWTPDTQARSVILYPGELCFLESSLTWPKSSIEIHH